MLKKVIMVLMTIHYYLFLEALSQNFIKQSTKIANLSLEQFPPTTQAGYCLEGLGDKCDCAEFNAQKVDRDIVIEDSISLVLLPAPIVAIEYDCLQPWTATAISLEAKFYALFAKTEEELAMTFSELATIIAPFLSRLNSEMPSPTLIKRKYLALHSLLQQEKTTTHPDDIMMIKTMCDEFARLIHLTTTLNQLLRTMLNILTRGSYKYKYILFNEAPIEVVDNAQKLIFILTGDMSDPHPDTNNLIPTLVENSYVIEDEWSVFKKVLI